MGIQAEIDELVGGFERASRESSNAHLRLAERGTALAAAMVRAAFPDAAVLRLEQATDTNGIPYLEPVDVLDVDGVSLLPAGATGEDLKEACDGAVDTGSRNYCFEEAGALIEELIGAVSTDLDVLDPPTASEQLTIRIME